MNKGKSAKGFFLNSIFKGNKAQAAPAAAPRGRGNPNTWLGNAGCAVRDFLGGNREIGGRMAGGWMFVFMAGMLYYLDMFLGYNGINVGKLIDNLAFIGIESYIGWFCNSIVITLLIAYYVIYRPEIQEFVSFFFLAELISVILFLGGLGTALIHLAFVFIFYFLYIRNQATGEGNTTANWITFVLLAFDFFGFGILANVLDSSVVSNRLIIPIWFYYSLIYTRNQERTFWIDILILIVILGNVFYFVGGINSLKNMSATLTPEDLKERENFISTSWKNVKDTIYKVVEGIRKDFDSQLEYATGGYYKGKMEKTQKEPLGVYITEAKTSQVSYYEGEQAIIFGTIKANNVDKGLVMQVLCNRKITPGVVGYDYATGSFNPQSAGLVSPTGAFLIYKQEQRDFECKLETEGFTGNPQIDAQAATQTTGASFGIGVHSITVGAEFGYSTMAYLRAYFMDQGRLREMRKEGIDVMKEYQITSKDAVATYTQGPVSIGMETTETVIGVDPENNDQYIRFGVTLENVQGWDGEIKSLSELVLLVPSGISIGDLQTGCTKKFKDYKYSDCKDTSCKKFVKDPCEKTCGQSSSCISQCAEDFNQCQKDCEVLFESTDESKFNAYSLDLDDKTQVQSFTSLARFKSISCQAKITDNILGNTPLTIKYFKALARYNYLIKKDVELRVEKDPFAAAKEALDKRMEELPLEYIIPADEKILTKIQSDYGSIINVNPNPELVMAVIKQESSGNPYAVSETGCAGLMQFCYPTAGDYISIFVKVTTCTKKCTCGTGCSPKKLGIDPFKDCGCDPYDGRFEPEKSIKAGAAYLKSFMESTQFKNYLETDKVKFSLGSYNGGKKVILDAITKAQDEGVTLITWDSIKSYITEETIPYLKTTQEKRAKANEIKDYVDKVYQTYNDLKIYSKETALIKSGQLANWKMTYKLIYGDNYEITITPPAGLAMVDGLDIYASYSLGNNELIDTIDVSVLKEKNPYTLNKQISPAPTGIYAYINGDADLKLTATMES